MFSIDPFVFVTSTFTILGFSGIVVSLIQSEEATRPVKKNILTSIIVISAAAMIMILFWKLVTDTPL